MATNGLGANLPEDAIYPFNLADDAGKPLDGANKYSIHFDKGTSPPVNAFWSITLYDEAGFQVANNLDRFAVSSWMPFKFNSDGSLDLYFQNESPGVRKRGQLATRAEGALHAHHASLRAEVRSPYRQVEPAAGGKDRRSALHSRVSFLARRFRAGRSPPCVIVSTRRSCQYIGRVNS